MADITKCKGDNCNKKETCYRYTATTNKYWQSWFSEAPNKGELCEQYINVEIN